MRIGYKIPVKNFILKRDFVPRATFKASYKFPSILIELPQKFHYNLS